MNAASSGRGTGVANDCDRARVVKSLNMMNVSMMLGQEVLLWTPQHPLRDGHVNVLVLGPTEERKQRAAEILQQN